MSNLAFHNDPQLAELVRGQVAAHAAADEIAQGVYWENGKGGFIGCIAHSSNPARVEELTGFPVMLTKLAESIFERLPNGQAKAFLPRAINAPKVGASLDLVGWKFLHWLVEDVLREHGTDDVRAGCAAALAVLADKAEGREVIADAAYAAYAAAYAAARAADTADAADAAAYAAARAAAYAADATYAAAAYAAARAADATYAAAAAYAADADAAASAADAARIRQADKFVELLEAAE